MLAFERAQKSVRRVMDISALTSLSPSQKKKELDYDNNPHDMTTPMSVKTEDDDTATNYARSGRGSYSCQAVTVWVTFVTSGQVDARKFPPKRLSSVYMTFNEEFHIWAIFQLQTYVLDTFRVCQTVVSRGSY